MLPLAAISRFIAVRAPHPNRAAMPLNPAIGHLGLTIITLVYVLTVLWRG
jgi:hypothetical protein